MEYQMVTGLFKKGGNMKRLLLFGSAVVALSSCNKGNGELIGVQNREVWFQADPYGMLYCPPGSYNMGQSDQDIPYAFTQKAKTVSVQAFYIDETEITNNEYRQFVYWVRDSIARRLLVDGGKDEFSIPEEDWFKNQPIFIGNNYPSPPPINWDEKIKWDTDDEEIRTILEDLYLPERERFYRRKEIDSRKLNFAYYWIDLRNAARKPNRFQYKKHADDDPNEDGKMIINGTGTSTSDTTLGSYNVTGSHYSTSNGPGRDRKAFINKEVINCYPDTLCWIHDFTYSFNEPMTENYFWHPAYDEYPVVGVSWKQATAFCVWRTQLLSGFLMTTGQTLVNDFRLPTESEWEYAARGGLDLSPYPWGGPYIRNIRGCFLGNFKPMRGSYFLDGGFHTVKVTSYSPNEFGLYCMAGNAAEWTSNAYDESAYDFSHDLNPDYLYDAKESDPSVLKRKVIRGGSWKDVGFYLQTGTRTYEYQDTAKSYIGFRCVMTYLGRDKGDIL
jgi:formylglycine-generating enzyme required for sulfatase activity